MKVMLKSFTMAIASFLMLSVTTQAQATSSTVVLNLEGNPTCDSLGDNASILAARDNGPQVGVNEVSGPRIDGMVQTIQYTIDASGEFPLVSWDILNQDEFVNPINYVIIKGQGSNGARVFHFGGIGEGAVSDTEEEATGNIAAVSFCYGLTEGPIDTPLAGIQDCAELDVENNLGGTLIGACPTPEIGDPKKRLLISLDLDADNFDIQSCTCNVPEGLPSCDPNVPVDEPGACIVTDMYDPLEGVNERVPVMIQGVETPNSYICYTIGGDRVCYGDF
jgi:hypothetical protein